MRFFLPALLLLLGCDGGMSSSDAFPPDAGLDVDPVDGDLQDTSLQDTSRPDHDAGNAGALDADSAGHDSGPADAGAPVNLDALESLSVGADHACGIRVHDHQVVCWGSDVSGQCTHAPEGSASQVTVGAGFSCAIVEGMTQCWGSRVALGPMPTFDPANPAIAIAAGADHACVLLSDGRARCWGGREHRVDPPPAGSYDALASGQTHSCAIRSDDHEVVCWGGGSSRSWEPFDGIAMSEVTTSSDITCGLREADGGLICSGREDVVADAPREGRFVSVRASNQHGSSVCALREDGEAFCWGRVWSASYDPDVPLRSLSVASGNVCGITLEGETRCWGYGEWSVMTGYPRSTEFHGIAASHAGLCAIDTTDHLWCFTRLSIAERPHGDTPFRAVAMNRTGGLATIRLDDGVLTYRGFSDESFDSVTFGSDGVMGIRSRDRAGVGVTDGRVLYEGASLRDLSPSCGLFEEDGHVECASVASPPRALAFRALGTGPLGCGIREDDQRAMCWAGPTGAPDEPVVSVTTSSGLGGVTACAIRAADGVVQCWGDEVPLPEEPMREITGISCGIRQLDGTMTCWGQYAWNPR